MIALILETIDKFGQYKNRRQFAHYAGEDAAGKWDDISSYLYLLLGKSWGMCWSGRLTDTTFYNLVLVLAVNKWLVPVLEKYHCQA